MKKVLKIISGIGMLLLLVACGNRQVFDTTYTFTYAEIKLPSGDIVKGNVSSWKDFEDGDTIQVVIDGVTYLTHHSNVVLMTKGR